MWFFTALIAKIASAGAVAQAATGAGIVLVGFTGIGAAGALPAPVQHSFATVVAAITPLDAPDGTDGSNSDGSTTDATNTPAATTTPAAPTTDAADPNAADVVGDPAATTSAPKNFGQKVSEQAHNGGVDGQTVSSWAHERNAARKSGAAGATETEAPESETEAPDSETADPSETESSDDSQGDSEDTQGDSEDAGSRTSGGHGSHKHG